MVNNYASAPGEKLLYESSDAYKSNLESLLLRKVPKLWLILSPDRFFRGLSDNHYFLSS